MADPTPTPNPQPDVKNPRQKSVFNHAQTAAMNQAEKIATVAQKPVYATALAAREIDATIPAQLLADIKSCRDTAASAAQSTTARQNDTGAEHTAEINLMTAVHEVQAAARQKYARTNPVTMHDYMISQRIGQNQATTKQAVDAIIAKLGKDALPGITTAKVSNLQTLLAAYIQAAANPSGSQSAATTQRKQRDAAVQSINDRRATIQFAADAE